VVWEATLLGTEGEERDKEEGNERRAVGRRGERGNERDKLRGERVQVVKYKEKERKTCQDGLTDLRFQFY
jgi:transcription antitermination factor NusA-like protein